MAKNNVVLKQMAYQLYQNRPVMPENYRTHYRIERVNGGFLCDLWFLTRGCTHDAQGGCTMCNYGKSQGEVEWEQILEELEMIVKRLPWEFEDFMLTPSGSMLDEREVPCELRNRLSGLLGKIRTKRFIVETRADTITNDGLDYLRTVVPKADKYIEIGVESSNAWILKHCVNKGIVFEDFCNAVEMVHQKGMYVTANVGLGQPFLDERASVMDAIHTIEDVLENGADSVVLFPYHIKKGTLLEVMHDKGMYECVSLWSLVRVLEHFSEKDLEKIQISWYKDYFGKERSSIMNSPCTCKKCNANVMKLLDSYRDSQNRTVVEKLSIYNCSCKKKWEEKLKKQCLYPELDHIEKMYRELACSFGIDMNLLNKQIKDMRWEYKEKILR